MTASGELSSTDSAALPRKLVACLRSASRFAALFSRRRGRGGERAGVVVVAGQRNVLRERQYGVERALQLACPPVRERRVEGGLGVVRVAELKHREILGVLLVVGRRARLRRRRVVE